MSGEKGVKGEKGDTASILSVLYRLYFLVTANYLFYFINTFKHFIPKT